MKHKLGIVCILLGAALIGSALLLFGYNRAEDAHAGTASQEAVSEIQKQIEQAQTVAMETQVTNQEDNINHSPEPSMDDILESDDEPYTTGPVTMVGDYEYIGVLDLPALNLSLPIMSDWDYERLKMAPCRQFGSAATDDLVIAGHNYINHFGSLGMLKAGDSVTFTGTDGAVNTYVVSETATISPTETEKVTESGYPLVLYTCTYGRQSRIGIYCSRA